MNAEHEPTGGYLDDGSIDGSIEFKADDKFFSVRTTDELGDDDIQEENADDLISSFRPGGDVANSARDEAFSYLQEIARIPLLTPDEEVELFQKFEDGRQRIAALSDQLPPLILEKVWAKTRPRRGAKRKSKRGLWWSPMNFATILDQIQSEIKAYQRVPTSENRTEESKRLNKLWRGLNDAAQQMQEAQLRIVEANLLLVASIAGHYHFPISSLSFLDLMQEGSIGLMRAVEKFDLKRGCRFSTYATWWIMQAITRSIDEQRQVIRVPCYVREMRRSIKQARARLVSDFGREPDIKEIAETVQMSESRVIEILQSAKDPISLSLLLSESTSDATISDLLVDESQVTPEEELISRSEKEALEKTLNTLSSREALVIKLRYGLTDGTAHTLAEIARQLGISRERVRQIEADALGKLRHPTRVQYLKELL